MCSNFQNISSIFGEVNTHEKSHVFEMHDVNGSQPFKANPCFEKLFSNILIKYSDLNLPFMLAMFYKKISLFATRCCDIISYIIHEVEINRNMKYYEVKRYNFF